MEANSLAETNFKISYECLRSKKSVCAGSSLLFVKLIIVGQMAYLNSVVVMKFSLDRMWNKLLSTAAERLGSFSTSIRAGITLRTSVFFSKLSMTLRILVRN